MEDSSPYKLFRFHPAFVNHLQSGQVVLKLYNLSVSNREQLHIIMALRLSSLPSPQMHIVIHSDAENNGVDHEL
jgi:hypothetical protein